ncbi:cadmium transporter [Thermobispora bispora]|uniref:Cadmium resistance transporter n=1 Tax=Thermobispora bispora (strain ATCC 19993 / DSM 43833 / CBS 139.67 / JCM 10125 / KCTC 9307 / NBRC 14880 / R51) TaxID=469371 RepID=D6Y3P8_THEBD|nr:cadmium resistance transporter [Thermobispora bispora]ADG87077.1 cadmium resistance transporter [Thermobispora bispora DSM 43833]MDI9579489.1 cadmium resistance transporter [Thermobispora sp.]
MDGILGTVGTAGAVFAGTNVDDIVILTVLFLSARAHGLPRPWQIIAGQYTGIAVTVVVSVIAALGLAILPDPWVGLVGSLPLAMGVRGLIEAVRAKDPADGSPPAVASGLLSVASITVANGADNISVYTPVFRTIGVSASLITIAVFAVLVAVWCLIGSWLGSHKKIIEFVERYGRWLVPLVFIAIGLVIVLESGVISLLADLVRHLLEPV